MGKKKKWKNKVPKAPKEPFYSPILRRESPVVITKTDGKSGIWVMFLCYVLILGLPLGYRFCFVQQIGKEMVWVGGMLSLLGAVISVAVANYSFGRVALDIVRQSSIEAADILEREYYLTEYSLYSRWDYVDAMISRNSETSFVPTNFIFVRKDCTQSRMSRVLPYFVANTFWLLFCSLLMLIIWLAFAAAVLGGMKGTVGA